ncbi:MAG: MFS transporter [Clostridia bacterium]|nr:MFS transporter [Clostridia bacterium]
MNEAGNEAGIRGRGYSAFFLSGVCAIASGVVVSLLQEKFGLTYAETGGLLSLMSVGNMLAAFLAGYLPGKIGTRAAVLTLTLGYLLGYGTIAATQAVAVLMAAFFAIGLAKGTALNRCTVMAGMHARDRGKSLQILHSCYACGALLCPFVVSGLSGVSSRAPMIGLAVCGLVMWLVFAGARFPGKQPGAAEKRKKEPADRSFLRSGKFWLLTAMVFCQNAAETSVTGWMVTYYRNQEILSGIFSAYTMTVMWSATLMARLLLAFVIPVRNKARALCLMGLACTVLYGLMIPQQEAVPAVAVLFLFSAAIAGVNPMSTAMTGSVMSPESMGILLPVAATGGILMPAVIGFVAGSVSLQAGMLVNLIPCAGIAILGWILWRKR